MVDTALAQGCLLSWGSWCCPAYLSNSHVSCGLVFLHLLVGQSAWWHLGLCIVSALTGIVKVYIIMLAR